MKIVTSSEKAPSVEKALGRAIGNANERLSDMSGRISKMEAGVDAGMSGGSVSISVAVDESRTAFKRLIWANESGSDERNALERAEEKVNERMHRHEGEVVSFHQEIISPPVPQRIYATLIVGVNEEIEDQVQDLTPSERRERLSSALQLLGNDSKTVNISRLAEVFGVSRDTIYRDLDRLGVDR